MQRLMSILAVAGLVIASPALARDEPKPRAKLFQDALDCAAITTDPERLACYDRAVSALRKGESDGQVVVVDRQQVGETRRSLFGFRLPSLRIFGGGANDDDLSKIETTIASISRSAQGQIFMTIADGARWVQSDDRPVAGKISPGDKVTISRGALGSYFASIPGRPAFKVERRN